MALVVLESRTALHHYTSLELDSQQTGPPQQFGQYRQYVAEFSLTDSDKLYPTGIIVCPVLVIYNCTSTDRNNYAEDSQTNQQTDKPRKNIISLSQVQ